MVLFLWVWDIIVCIFILLQYFNEFPARKFWFTFLYCMSLFLLNMFSSCCYRVCELSVNWNLSLREIWKKISDKLYLFLCQLEHVIQPNLFNMWDNFFFYLILAVIQTCRWRRQFVLSKTSLFPWLVQGNSTSTIQTGSGAKLKPRGRWLLLSGLKGCVLGVVECY